MNEKRSLTEIAERKHGGDKLTMVTAYDHPSARMADAANVDLLLVGDSAADNVLGYDSTIPVTVEELLVLVRAVARGAERALVVADMPFGSFQLSDKTAVANAIRFVKEGGADAVKLEGAGPALERVRAIVGAGVPVMGHVGLTPQSATLLGGLRAQGRTAAKAWQLVADARALEAAGCFAVVLEAVPAPVAASITQALLIPTIGIGAGPECDGQVLVWHDLLGLSRRKAPRFVKRYAELGDEIARALAAYVGDVRSGAFPGEEHTYSMPDEELRAFESAVKDLDADSDRGQRGRGDGRERRASPAPSLGLPHPDDEQGKRPSDEAELEPAEQPPARA
jgi:3-methyl-2-oxobutanoate hydroxymethyltransferase